MEQLKLVPTPSVPGRRLECVVASPKESGTSFSLVFYGLGQHRALPRRMSKSVNARLYSRSQGLAAKVNAVQVKVGEAINHQTPPPGTDFTNSASNRGPSAQTISL